MRRGAAVRAPDGSITFNLLTPAGEVIGRQPATGGRLYDLRDALGSVRAVVDASGAVVESRAYDAWGLAMAGRTSGPAAAREGFTGKERDAALGGPLGGLDDFGARTYSPLLGRFLQTDPAAADYPSWSPYTYTFNRPVSLVDPDGRRPTQPEGAARSADDEWRVNQRTGEIERVGSRGGSQTDYYSIGSDVGGSFVVTMRITLERNDGDINMFRIQYGEDFTISSFHAPGHSLRGFMLEPGGPATATPNQDRRVPEGLYDINAYRSRRFPDNYILSNGSVSVDRRILIHSGTYPRHTTGCLLPGAAVGDGMVIGSRIKMRELRNHLRHNPAADLNIVEGAYSKRQP
jgi:RHS repeat-associated protein